MTTNEKRLQHIIRFYTIMDTLKDKLGGYKRLETFTNGSSWVKRGVYFFFEDGELRSDSGEGMRVVHVGTHAMRDGGNTTLWDRLRNHRGSEKSGGGNHRCSAIRKHIGQAYLDRDPGHRIEKTTWANGTFAPWDIRLQEHDLEMTVSNHIRNMPFLYLGVEDDPSPYSQRGYISRNVIGLLSNYDKPPIDSPSDQWLGLHVHSPGDRIHRSGLWNVKHVDHEYDPHVLMTMDLLVKKM